MHTCSVTCVHVLKDTIEVRRHWRAVLPFVTQQNGSKVVPMSDDPAHSLVDGSGGLLLVPLLRIQGLQPGGGIECRTQIMDVSTPSHSKYCAECAFD